MRAGNAVKLMFERNIKKLPVVENGRLVGLIALADLLRTRGYHLSKALFRSIDSGAGIVSLIISALAYCYVLIIRSSRRLRSFSAYGLTRTEEKVGGFLEEV